VRSLDVLKQENFHKGKFSYMTCFAIEKVDPKICFKEEFFFPADSIAAKYGRESADPGVPALSIEMFLGQPS